MFIATALIKRPPSSGGAKCFFDPTITFRSYGAENHFGLAGYKHYVPNGTQTVDAHSPRGMNFASARYPDASEFRNEGKFNWRAVARL